VQYQVIHLQTRELKTLTASDIVDMDYDSEGRVMITAADQKIYLLLANRDLVEEI